MRIFQNQEDVIQHHIGAAKLAAQQDGLVFEQALRLSPRKTPSNR